MTFRLLSRCVAATSLCMLAASCKDGGGPDEIGPPASLTLRTTTIPRALANTTVPTVIELVVKDANGHPVPNVIISFAVTAGNGSLATLADTSDANGVVEVKNWTLGKSANAQIVTASIGSVTLDVHATVQTSYAIEVRFFGPAMTAAQKALFMNAAARLSGIVTGDVVDADASQANNGQGFDLGTTCGVSGQPPFKEVVDDVIIYASIRDIDGPGKVLASAGPCLTRDTGPASNPQPMPAVGEMQFDSADIDALTGGGSLQDVITHEMLHVLGFGVLWDDRGLLKDTGTVNPRYTGEGGRQGCVAIGGSIACAVDVPVEGGGGDGTRNAHWRESTFDNELMTGFIDNGANPISKMTIGSLADLGYVVNAGDFDNYTIALNAFRADGGRGFVVTPSGWERRPTHGVWVLRNGSVLPMRVR